MTNGITDLAVVILIAAALGVLARFLKQPIIVAYLATGAFIGWRGLFDIANQETFQTFADLGIMFLLFLIGLEINYLSLRAVGKVSLIVGLGQVIFTSLIGFGIAKLFGFELVPALYIAIALTFSSTVIIIKLLSERGDTNSLYGKVSIGMLLVQDLVAILILIALAGFEGQEGFQLGSVLRTLLIGASLLVFMLWLGRRILPWLFDRVARHHELLFLISIAWLFLIVAVVEKIGLSIEIGGFLAGIALANSAENFQIASKIRPLRDFFILVFFVILGSSFVLHDGIAGITLPVIAFSLFVLIGNPLVVLVIMGMMGYRKRTSFLTGLTVAQISEFSLVLAALGERVGHIGRPVVALITAVGIVTITISTYLILYADAIYPRFARVLRIFERRNAHREDGWKDGSRAKEYILIGAHRTGQSIAMSLPKEQLLIVEFDPEIVEELGRLGFDYLFGDIADPDVIEKIDWSAARLVVSTSPSFEDNLTILSELMRRDPRPKIILRADDEWEAEKLYEKGADYVLLPNFTAGQYLGKTIAVDPEIHILEHLKKRDYMMLKNRHGYLMQ
jgi:Kef-type K+ transport system membrane component KefB